MALQENRVGAHGGQTFSQPAGDTGIHGFRREAHPQHTLPGGRLHPEPLADAALAARRSQDRPALPPTHLWGCRLLLAGSRVPAAAVITNLLDLQAIS